MIQTVKNLLMGMLVVISCLLIMQRADAAQAPQPMNKIDMQALVDTLVKNEETFILKFYADWCGPCKLMNPVVDRAEKELGIKVIHINIDKCDFAKDIRSVPTLHVYNKGVFKGEMLGYKPYGMFIKELQGLLIKETKV